MVSVYTSHKSPVPKNMFLFFNAEITPVHWSLIITAYMTLSHALSCDGLLQRPFRSQTKGPWEASSVKLTPPDTYSIVAVVITNQGPYILTSWDMPAAPHAAAALSVRCCWHVKTGNNTHHHQLMFCSSQTHHIRDAKLCSQDAFDAQGFWCLHNVERKDMTRQENRWIQCVQRWGCALFTTTLLVREMLVQHSSSFYNIFSLFSAIFKKAPLFSRQD